MVTIRRTKFAVYIFTLMLNTARIREGLRARTVVRVEA